MSLHFTLMKKDWSPWLAKNRSRFNILFPLKSSSKIRTFHDMTVFLRFFLDTAQPFRQSLLISLVANTRKSLKLLLHIFTESFWVFLRSILIFSSRFWNKIAVTLSVAVTCWLVCSTDLFFSCWFYSFCESTKVLVNFLVN